MARSPGSALASLGEFGLIERLRHLVPTTGPGVIIGIGDDAAVLRFSAEAIATCDIQVEGVHFTWDLCRPEDLGWRALAVNLSDIAAMAGVPRYALVSLALPPETTLATVDGLYAGLAEAALAYSVVIVGGNVSGTSGPFAVDITVLGEGDRVLSRAGAHPGDAVWITGSVGKAAAGLFLLQHPGTNSPAGEALVRAYRRPIPRVMAGRVLAATGLVTAMIDSSDGTASDLLHLAEASKAGARLDLDCLPVPAGLEAAARAAGRDPAAWTLGGGEDYELLFTAAPAFEARAAHHAEAAGVPLTRIGEILPEAEGRWVLGPGAIRSPLRAAGWDHFQNRG